jgi:DUF1009 family protein
MSVALIAGEGTLPEEIARRLSSSGKKPVIYAIRESYEEFLEYASEVAPIFRTELAATLKDMLARGIREVILAGAVPKTLIYRSAMLDGMAREFVASLEVRDDHTILGGIVGIFERAGFQVIGYREILRDLLAPDGLIAGRSPSGDERADIEYGLQIAGVVVPLSFGQSVVVNKRSVVAVEAMEGTDATILRAGSLCRSGVLVKMMKRGQDPRYDIPTVGPKTLDLMSSAGLTCLAIQTGWTLILSPDEFASAAEARNISVVGIDY